MTQPKERPILFSAPMVRAILEGRKTITRREVKKRAALDCLAAGFDPEFLTLPGNSDLCPYGQPGDRMWVRETFAHADKSGSHDSAPDDHWRPIRPGMEPEVYRCWYRASDGHTADGFWKPSIHMPRWASRILLEITDVHVERLQAISRADIRAEGLQCPAELASDDVSPNYRDWYPAAWRELWETINGPDSWSANPWVWCVNFRRIEP